MRVDISDTKQALAVLDATVGHPDQSGYSFQEDNLKAGGTVIFWGNPWGTLLRIKPDGTWSISIDLDTKE